MINYSKIKLLFITEKYCDGEIDKGITNSYHNLFGSLKHSGLNIPFKVVHYDQCMIEHSIHLDNVILKILKDNNINVIIHSFLGKSPCNLSHDKLKQIKDLGIFQCVTWPDTGYDFGHKDIVELKDIIDFNVSFDNCFNYHEIHKNHIWLLI